MSCCCLSLDHSATVYPFAYWVPVYQPGLQFPRPLRQLQQRHLLPQPLQRLRGLGHRAACWRPPASPAGSPHHLAKLCVQQLRRTGPQRKQNPASLQRVREEQPPPTRAAAPQSVHPTTAGPPSVAPQASPAAHGQHEAGRNLRPSSPQTEAPAQEGVPAIGAGPGPALELEETHWRILHFSTGRSFFFFFYDQFSIPELHFNSNTHQNVHRNCQIMNISICIC